jgi:hemerythrin-like metal-binding protein
MAGLVWKDSYSVGVASMDEQHKKLFVLIRQLNDAMLAGKGKEVVGQTLDEMIKYVQVHFTAEEKLLSKYNYPGLIEQRREHAAFIEKVSEMQNKLHSGSLTVSVEASQFLSHWISEHIMGIDKKYSAFLASKGEK